MISYLQREWLYNIRGDVLAGFTSILALIPDCLAFSFMAGVNPMMGIYSAISILIVISFFGGRPAMLSSSAGSMSVLMIAFVSRYGIEYLFAATILTGIMQLLMGVSKLGRLMNYVPHAVVTGFVNALAILIFLAQLKNFAGESWPMYGIVACTLLIIYLFPKVTKTIPSPLVAVIVMTIITLLLGLHTGTVGDIAKISTTLPVPHVPHIVWSWHSLLIIVPLSFSLAIVGSTETLLTQTLIDEITETKSNKNRELFGQGIANTVTGFCSGMAGCALVAESCLNANNGGRSRLSTLTAGVVLLILVQLFGRIVSIIPMATLVGVMVMICIQLFDWKFLFQIHRLPKAESITMIATVAVVLPTHNLAYGVIVGVLISSIIFVYNASHISVQKNSDGDNVVYQVKGQLFFASANQLENHIDFYQKINHVYIDLSSTHLWDHTAHTAILKLIERLKRQGKDVKVQYGTHSLPNLVQ